MISPDTWAANRLVRTDRIPCEVMGCRRTAPREKHPGDVMIICGKCMSTAHPYNRQRYRLARRNARAALAAGDGGEAERWGNLWNFYFARLVRDANDAKVGLR